MSRRSNWHYLSLSTVKTDAPIGAAPDSECELALRRASPRRYSVCIPRFTVNTAATGRPEPLRIGTPTRADNQSILSPEALEFLAALNQQFGRRVSELLSAREQRKRRIQAGEALDFLPATRKIRESEWRIAEVPADLLDRRVEITGPTDRKMTINALNSGARVFMADCEDSLSPTWENIIGGQQNLYDAVRRQIEFVSPEGKVYRLNRSTAVLIVRPRSWHLYERHLTQGAAQVAGALVDFGLYLFHNARELIAHGSGAYFYLPKMESHLEARLWAEIFTFAEEYLQLPRATIRCTVLIETLLAAFEMDEILWELKDFITGLNCGRWDYIFSFIKLFSERPDSILPDRQRIDMTTHFLRSYSLLCIKTCHRRGAFAMGGMAAQIPIKNDPAANQAALEKVRADKEREVADGHDGTWVAHPGLVPIAREIFDRVMQSPNQVHRLRNKVNVSAADLLTVPTGEITAAGLLNNVSVSLQYLASWLGGNGCVPINNLMEDAATAEIARSQIWQWVHHPGGVLNDGRKVTLELFRALLQSENERLAKLLGDGAYSRGHFLEATRILDGMTSAASCADFLTVVAYPQLQ
jgi:malate synthase